MVEHKPPEESAEPKEPQASVCANPSVPCVTAPEQSTKNDQFAPDIDRFFCIYCGYDLTGHSGDERRCPECGRATSLEELRAALAMESIGASEAPVVPSLLFLPTAFFAFPCVISLFQNSS